MKRQRGLLKPSALRLLARLLRGPALNRELLALAGFGWACRLSELRAANYEVRCRARPSKGLRTYTLQRKRRAA